MGLFGSSSLVLVIGVVITAGVWIGLTRLLRHHWPWWSHLSANQQPASALDITKIALSVVGGVGAAIALTVTYRRQRDLERGRFDERFAAAAAQLGGASAAQRLAGVYAIAALADETDARRQQCIDPLCAYLRLPYDPAAGLLKTVVSEHTWPIGQAEGKETRTYERLTNDRDVRLAIIDVIRDRLQDRATTSWAGHDFNFRGATVTFDSTQFTGATVNFRDAQFSGGTVNFAAAGFDGGTVYFGDAQFTGATVTFGARFYGGIVAFRGAQFSGGTVEFGGARFYGGTVAFGDAQFTGGTVNFHELWDLSTPPVGLPDPPPSGLTLPSLAERGEYGPSR